MKTNRFLIAILSVALCVNFVSCGDDDDNNIIDPENVTKRVATCTKNVFRSVEQPKITRNIQA